jgi:hypothetical protein
VTLSEKGSGNLLADAGKSASYRMMFPCFVACSRLEIVCIRFDIISPFQFPVISLDFVNSA